MLGKINVVTGASGWRGRRGGSCGDGRCVRTCATRNRIRRQGSTETVGPARGNATTSYVAMFMLTRMLTRMLFTLPPAPHPRAQGDTLTFAGDITGMQHILTMPGLQPISEWGPGRPVLCGVGRASCGVQGELRASVLAACACCTLPPGHVAAKPTLWAGVGKCCLVPRRHLPSFTRGLAHRATERRSAL